MLLKCGIGEAVGVLQEEAGSGDSELSVPCCHSVCPGKVENKYMDRGLLGKCSKRRNK